MHQSTTRRRALLGGGAALAGTAAFVGTGTHVSADDDDREQDAAAIRQLSINYAIGTDAVARGDLATARDRYAATFTADSAISAGFDRTAPALTASGWEEWMAVVVEAFVPYTATQHLLGTIDIRFTDRRRRRAAMTTYLTATHVLAASKELSTVLGTYVDEVAKVGGGWRITSRFLQFTAFETSPRTLP